MLMFNKIQIDKLDEKIDSYRHTHPKYTNYFMPELSDMEYWEGEHTLLLKKVYEGYNRIYFLSNNRDELMESLSDLSKYDSINVPYRRERNQDLYQTLIDGGYILFQTYERLSNFSIEQRGEFVENYANLDDVNDIDELLHKHFHPISDRLPSKDDLIKYVSNNQVQVCRDKDTQKVKGVIIFEICGKLCNFLEWASDASVGESLFLYMNAFNMLVQNGVNKCTLWVRCGNKRARQIYDILGFHADGLLDDTYLKPDTDN